MSETGTKSVTASYKLRAITYLDEVPTTIIGKINRRPLHASECAKAVQTN